MKTPFKLGRAATLLLACASPLGLAGLARAQAPYATCPPTFMPNCPPGGVQLNPLQPGATTPNPTTPNTPNPNTTAPNATTPDNTTQPAPDTTGQNPDVSLNNEGSGARGGETVALGSTGYIDCAIPQTNLRLRWDDGLHSNQPDRVEFFYARCGGPGGPPNVNRNVNFQEYSTYLEYAPTQRFSAFVEAPERTVSLSTDGTFTGFADTNFGTKFALIYDPCQVLTFQFRTYAPSGDPHRGLGTQDWSIEPSLLYHRRLSDRLDVDGEFRYWDTFPGRAYDKPEAGSFIRYGVGLSYALYEGPSFKFVPVAETVGWTMLSGGQTSTATSLPEGVRGVTIVNEKIGARFYFGDGCGNTLLDRSDIYAGYGRALTGSFWYRDIYRLEYRLRF